jgi:hypothetical protein
MKYLVGSLSVLALAACGSEGSGKKFDTPSPATAPEQWSSVMLDTAEALPACSPERKGWLAYIKDSAQFQACDGSVWSAVDLKGKDGEAGKEGVAGKDGKSGKDGKDGTDNRIVSGRTCNASAYIGDFNFYGVASLEVRTMSSGDVFVKCEIITDSKSISGSAFWRKDTVGADNHSCGVVLDVDGSDNYGSWSFEKTGFSYQPDVLSSAVIATDFIEDDCTSL